MQPNPTAAPVKKRNEAEVVMAFDMSVSRTGWAISDLDGTTSGAQSFPITGGENPAVRFHRFDRWVEATLMLQKPDVVIYEKNNYKTMKFSHSIYCSAALSNRLDVHCAVLGISTLEIMPNAVKMAFTGKGGSDPKKKRMKARAAELWTDYEPEKDVGGDEADARAIAWCYVNRERLKLFEFEPVKAPRKPPAFDTHIRAYRARQKIINGPKMPKAKRATTLREGKGKKE
jgi:Holliday junction resolvasome RuvABC endonuclease subunit